MYNGDGVRLKQIANGAVTTYTLDYAAGHRILVETTAQGTTFYLYGYECLGEHSNNAWLYYLNTADGYVRQTTDASAHLVSAWVYSPDGLVLVGPQGTVSHLVCGGVYDWATGLIYRNGRYFDPTLGIWLGLAPLVVLQSWQGRRKRRRGPIWPMLLLLAVCVGVTACVPGPTPTPTPCPPTLTPTPDPRAAEIWPLFIAAKLSDGPEDYQKVIDRTIEVYNIDLVEIAGADSYPKYDPDDPNLALYPMVTYTNATVRVGRKAFEKSPGWTASAIAHEQIHLRQLIEGRMYFSNIGSSFNEAEAYQWQLDHAAEFGLTPAEIEDFDFQFRAYYNTLSEALKQRVDSRNYELIVPGP